MALSVAAYVIFLVYEGLSYFLIADGTKDFIYQLTGIPRTAQVLAVTGIFLVYLLTVSSGILLKIFAPDYFPQHRLSWSPLLRRWERVDFTSAKRAVTISFFLLSLNFLSASLPAIFTQLSPQFWIVLFAYVAVILALQALAVFTALTLVRSFSLVLALLVGLSALNLYAMHGVLRQDFHAQTDPAKVGIILILSIVLAVFFSSLARRWISARYVNAILLITMVAPGIPAIFAQNSPAIEDKRMTGFTGMEFQQKPNVHLLSFDSLIPPSLAHKHMGLDNLPYRSLLRREDVTVFRNAFASHVPTTASLNSVMRLAHPDFARIYEYFNGGLNSPVANVFAENGYGIATGYANLYLGVKGPYVTDYHPASDEYVQVNVLCGLALDSPFKFFGFCDVASAIQGDGAQSYSDWPDKVIERIRSAENAPESWLTFHYIFDPIGHTPLDYQSADAAALREYKESYLERSGRVADILERTTRMLREDRTPSILFVFGDHGPYLSRTIPIEQDKEFVIQDQYGILAAVLVNETDCGPQDLQHYVTTFATPERILAGIMRCLAREPKRLDAAINFQEAHDVWNFLYE